MSVKINYAMLYTEQIRDLILDKLTILFNKAMLGGKIRLLLRIPDMFDLKRVQRYREIFDEVSISRFTIDSSVFWNMRNLLNFQEYCMSMDNNNEENIFIEQGILVFDVPEPFPTADVVVAGIHDHESLMTQYVSIVELLQEAGYEIELVDDFTCWNLCCCHFSNELKKVLYFKLEEVIGKICNRDRYISNIESHILLSVLIDEITDDDTTVENLQLKKAKLDPELIENMYTLI